MEIVNITREIFQNHRIVVMQSFVVETRTVQSMEYLHSLMILAMILKKKNRWCIGCLEM